MDSLPATKTKTKSLLYSIIPDRNKMSYGGKPPITLNLFHPGTGTIIVDSRTEEVQCNRTVIKECFIPQGMVPLGAQCWSLLLAQLLLPAID